MPEKIIVGGALFEQERLMRESFQQAAGKVLLSEDFFRKASSEPKMGLEIEYSLLDANFQQATESQRDAIVHENPGVADIELGSAQLEIKTPPVNLREGLSGYVGVVTEIESRIRESAKNNGVFILRAGVNPIVWLHDIKRTDKEKYKTVPDFHNQNRKPETDTRIGIPPYTVDVGDAGVIALCNSVQFNVEAQDFHDAVDKLNRSLMISPYVTALCANARFLADRDTRLADLRNIAWEVSHDTRTNDERAQLSLTRVGLPSRYYGDIQDYFDQISGYPFILNAPEAAFPIGIGLNWRDVRIKFIENSLVVEFRPVSTQTTPDENIAASLFYLGRLAWSQQMQEQLLPFECVRQNKDEVMKNGISGTLWALQQEKARRKPTVGVLEEELAKAETGIQMLGLEDANYSEYFDLLRARFSIGIPVDRFSVEVYKFINAGFTSNDTSFLHEALILAMSNLKVI